MANECETTPLETVFLYRWHKWQILKTMPECKRHMQGLDIRTSLKHAWSSVFCAFLSPRTEEPKPAWGGLHSQPRAASSALRRGAARGHCIAAAATTG